MWIHIGIRIQLVLADPDPDPMDWAQNSKYFTFFMFENLSSGSKVMSLQSWVLFLKVKNLADTTLKIRVTSENRNF